VRWRSAKLQAEKQALEKLVAERTQEIAVKNVQLKELDALKSSFFANISHEFRTPLTLLLGPLEQRLTTAADAKEKQVFALMHRNARRLLTLVNQLLDLSKLEAGKMQLETKPVEITSLLKVLTASFDSLAQSRNIQFSKQWPPMPAVCLLDEDKFEKILTNLLSNAFKFTPDGGIIGIAAALDYSRQTRNQQTLTLRIWDNGLGIDTSQQARIFDRFSQGEHAPSYTTPGTGIGLALTKELVALHGGQISLQSKPGQGAQFTVSLPLSLVDEPVPQESQTEAVDATTPVTAPLPVAPRQWTPPGAAIVEDETVAKSNKPLLLIVEDSEDLRGYLKDTFAASYRVLQATNGIEGFELAVQRIPDLIISDWMMPERNGEELCQLLKTDVRTSHIPFVMLTALADSTTKLAGLERGADDYLTKPFEYRELLLRVKNLVEGRKKLQQQLVQKLTLEPASVEVASLDEQFLYKVKNMVETYLADPEFSVEQLAREVGVSRMQLHRKVTALTGQSPRDFIRTLRLKRAAQLLAGHSGTVSEIAYEVGFESRSYFSQCFRDMYGVIPTEYAVKPASKSA
jgi:DNA-binding response OmpR family regulator/nitrogen-specific signal transduction histidine kinase